MRVSMRCAASFLTLAVVTGLAGGAQAQSAREREEKAQSKPSRSENSSNNDSKTEVYQTYYPVGVPVIVGGGGGGGGVSSSAPRYGGARYGNSPRIAFVSDRTGTPAACVMWENGSVRETISRPGDAVHDIAFSPFRGRIACTVSSPGGQGGHILLLNANGRKPKQLDVDRSARGLSWSLDDEWIVYSSDKTGNSELYAASADGKKTRRLTDHPGRDADPVFSSDGQWVYFTSDRGGKNAIYRLRWDGSGTAERVTPADAPPASQPACQPWGDAVAYVAEDPTNKKRSDIFVIEVGTKKISQLTMNDGQNVNPTFSPDGSHIAYSSNHTGVFSIYSVPRQGGLARQITFGPGNDTHPSWW